MNETSSSSSPIITIIVIILVMCGAVILYPTFTNKQHAHSACISDTKQFTLGLIIYETDYDDRLPTAYWMDDIAPYLKNEELFHHRLLEGEERANVPVKEWRTFRAFDSRLLQADTKLVPDLAARTMVYDSTSQCRNSVDPLSSLPPQGYHKGFNNVGYMDGHAKAIKAAKIKP